MFVRSRVVVFCDGDFWHGRDLDARIARLARGHNSAYWVEKIRTNVRRDQQRTEELRALGWVVLRFWESDIKANAPKIATQIARVVHSRLPRQLQDAKRRALRE